MRTMGRCDIYEGMIKRLQEKEQEKQKEKQEEKEKEKGKEIKIHCTGD